MDKKITQEQIDKVTDFQRLILSAYEISKTPNGHRVNLFILTNAILQNIFFYDSMFRDNFLFTHLGTGLDLHFFVAVIINFVNPPINKGSGGIKFLRYDKIVNYLKNFFTMIKVNFLFFIEIFKKAFSISPSPDKKICNIAVFMILHIYQEIAFCLVEYPRNPATVKWIKENRLISPNSNSVGSMLQEAIFAVALNCSSNESFSLNIHLPECGDCLTVFSDNSPSSMTELKSNRSYAETALFEFLRDGVKNKITNQPIIGCRDPNFTFCSAYNSEKFLLKFTQSNAGNGSNSAAFVTSATSNEFNNNSSGWTTVSSSKRRKAASHGIEKFLNTSRESDNWSIGCKLLFTNLQAKTLGGFYKRDESSFLVGITANDLDNLDSILNQCIRSLIKGEQLPEDSSSISLLATNFPPLRQLQFERELSRLKSLTIPLTGQVDLSTGKIVKNRGIFNPVESWCLSPELSKNSRVLNLKKENSKNSINSIKNTMNTIIRQNLQSAFGAKAVNFKIVENSRLNLKNSAVLGSENSAHTSENLSSKSQGFSGESAASKKNSNQNAGAKKPAKKESVSKQSKKADAKKLTVKKDAKKTTKSKTAAKKKTTK